MGGRKSKLDNENHVCPPKSADERKFNIDETRLAELITCRSESDGSISVFETLQALLVKHHCHSCNKSSLDAILRKASEIQPDLLCINFVTQMVANVHSNQDKLDWELVQMIARTIRNFLDNRRDLVKEHKSFVAGNLLPMARMLLSRYFDVEPTDLDRSLLGDVLDLLSAALRTVRRYNPDQQLERDLVESFVFDPWKVSLLACSIFESIGMSERCWEFWSGFANGIHVNYRTKWQSDHEFAYKYATIITNYEKTFNKKTNHYLTWMKHLSTEELIEVLRQASMIPSRKMLDFLTRLTLPKYLHQDLLTLFSEKIAWALNQPINLHHDSHSATFESAKQLNCQLKQPENVMFLNDLVRTLFENRFYLYAHFNYTFIIALLRLASYDLDCDKSYNDMMIRVVSDHIDFKNVEERAPALLTIQCRMAQTVRGAIDNLDEDCMLCKLRLKLLYLLLTRLTLAASKIKKGLASLQCSNSKVAAKLASLVPYAIREKNRLIETMHPDGYALLIKQLERGEDVESLYMLARTFRPKLFDTWETISCTSQPMLHTEDTKVFVLDDGTKIQAEKSRLVENSEYFSHLFDERFAEASLDEIRLPDVSAFQFNFLVDNITSKPSTYKINFDMDAQAHLDLIVLCDRLVLQDLCDSVIDSLRWHHMDEESCPEVYRAGVLYGIVSLRKACVNFALVGDVHMAPNLNVLQNLFQQFDKKLLVDDIKEWMMEEHDSATAYFAKKNLENSSENEEGSEHREDYFCQNWYDD